MVVVWSLRCQLTAHQCLNIQFIYRSQTYLQYKYHDVSSVENQSFMTLWMWRKVIKVRSNPLKILGFNVARKSIYFWNIRFHDHGLLTVIDNIFTLPICGVLWSKASLSSDISPHFPVKRLAKLYFSILRSKLLALI